MSASFFCVSWNEPIGLSNWMRVLAYSSADSKQARAAPIAPKTIPKRASSRQASGAAHADAVGQHRVGGQAHVVEDELAA